MKKKRCDEMIKEDKKKKQSGITLMILVITIAVALILFATTFVGLKVSMDKVNLTAFGQDLYTIQDAVTAYYIQNDDFPVKDGTVAMSQVELLNLIDSNNRERLISELKLNGDFNETDTLGVFYPIDSTKLQVESGSMGLRANGEDDIFVVSYPSLNIYYLKGLKVGGDYYYSLSAKILSKVSIKQNTNIDESTTTIQKTTGITVKKVNKNWSNKMRVSINAYLNAGEELYLNVGTQDRKITTKAGENSFYFDTLEEIFAGTANIKIPTLVQSDIDEFSSRAPSSKKLTIIKKKGTTILGSIVVEVPKYENIKPVIIEYPKTIEQENQYMVTLKVGDSVSGIKQIRYDYLNKFDESGMMKPYYDNITSFDEAYMKLRAKEAKVDEKTGYTELLVPKNITSIQIAVFDVAGNMQTMEYALEQPIKIGVTPRIVTEEQLTFMANFETDNGLNRFATSVSYNGVDYFNAIEYIMNAPAGKANKICADYVSLSNPSDIIYLKIEAQNFSGIKTTRVFEIQKKDSTLKEPVIPEGFRHVEGEVETGYVIEDTTTYSTRGSQFVWIPVPSIQDFTRQIPTYNDATRTLDWNKKSTDYKESEVTEEYLAMKKSVAKYGGFYLARYEAGIATSMPQTPLTTNSTATYATGDYKPVSTKNAIVWNYISWGGNRSNSADDGYAGSDASNGAVKVARAMYPETEPTGVVSTLIYGVQWDATMKYLSDLLNENVDKPYIINSTKMGWFKENASNEIKRTGTLEAAKAKNIYDLAGNVSEWTMETKGSSERNTRGYAIDSSYRYISIANVVSANLNNDYPDKSQHTIGFRVALYLK